MDKREWTREEEILALALYCQIPFSKTVKSNPKIVELAMLINRTPSSVAMKLGNFGTFDSTLREQGIKGLSNASYLDKQIWNEFSNNWENLANKAAELRVKFSRDEQKAAYLKEGKENFLLVKSRINQDFFRNSVLASYNEVCCISGLKERTLLEAAHISRWADDKENRLNPSNGLCLNVLLHRAYDKDIFSISPDWRVVVAQRYKTSEDKTLRELVLQYDGEKISLPSKFLPDCNLLKRRYEKFLESNKP